MKKYIKIILLLIFSFVSISSFSKITFTSPNSFHYKIEDGIDMEVVIDSYSLLSNLADYIGESCTKQAARITIPKRDRTLNRRYIKSVYALRIESQILNHIINDNLGFLIQLSDGTFLLSYTLTQTIQTCNLPKMSDDPLGNMFFRSVKGATFNIQGKIDETAAVIALGATPSDDVSSTIHIVVNIPYFQIYGSGQIQLSQELSLSYTILESANANWE